MRPESVAPISGSCLCGGVAYEIRGPIAGINYCHCRQCRKASGSAFGTSAAVARADFALVDGQAKMSTHESSPGKRRWFCGTCGSPLYSEREGAETIYVRLGTVGDDPGVRPDVHIHVASKAPWHEIGDDLPQRREEEDLWF